jgi:formate dehydrogenase
MGRCDAAPAVAVGHRHLAPATVASVEGAVAAGDVTPAPLGRPGIDDYRRRGGYATLAACLEGKTARDDVIAAMSDASLRGLGGAGFPTGRKWSLVRGEAKPRLMAVNADEGEVGTFKDRAVLETAPHRFLEGVLIAAWVVEAEAVYIYLRDEYPAIREMLLDEMAAVARAGLAPHTKLHLRRGAGAYICGEESAMLESIEGKRGYPRHRPPYVAQVGLFGRPTLVNNVETLYWVPEILRRGAKWFADQGRRGSKGVRHFSVSGRVRSPGVKLAPAGITLRELVEEHCGGMAPGHTLKAYLPGGASGGILPASLADLPLDFGVLKEYGAFVGSHAVVVLSDRDDLTAAALNLMKFFEHESCGQCTPCRVGTEKSVALMARSRWDRALLDELGKAMTDASICGLGQAAANPLFSLLRFFPDEAPS